MLARRILFGLLLAVMLLAVVWGDDHIAAGTLGLPGGGGFTHGSVIPLVIFLLALAGAWEGLKIAELAGFEPIGGAVLLCVAILNGLTWLLPAFAPQADPFRGQLAALALAAVLLGAWQVCRGTARGGLGNVSVSMMLVVYMGLLPAMMMSIRTSLPGRTGALAILMFVAVVKCTDIGAYFTGLAIGQTRLLPAVSPAKTVEGFAGGTLAGIAAAVLLARWLPWPEQAATAIDALQAAVFGTTMAVLGQCGDLMESIFKRNAAAKDSAALIPTFGGILDVLDSPAFAAPAGFLLLGAWLG